MGVDIIWGGEKRVKKSRMDDHIIIIISQGGKTRMVMT